MCASKCLRLMFFLLFKSVFWTNTVILPKIWEQIFKTVLLELLLFFAIQSSKMSRNMQKLQKALFTTLAKQNLIYVWVVCFWFVCNCMCLYIFMYFSLYLRYTILCVSDHFLLSSDVIDWLVPRDLSGQNREEGYYAVFFLNMGCFS